MGSSVGVSGPAQSRLAPTPSEVADGRRSASPKREGARGKSRRRGAPTAFVEEQSRERPTLTRPNAPHGERRRACSSRDEMIACWLRARLKSTSLPRLRHARSGINRQRRWQADRCANGLPPRVQDRCPVGLSRSTARLVVDGVLTIQAPCWRALLRMPPYRVLIRCEFCLNSKRLPPAGSWSSASFRDEPARSRREAIHAGIVGRGPCGSGWRGARTSRRSRSRPPARGANNRWTSGESRRIAWRVRHPYFATLQWSRCGAHVPSGIRCANGAANYGRRWHRDPAVSPRPPPLEQSRHWPPRPPQDRCSARRWRSDRRPE